MGHQRVKVVCAVLAAGASTRLGMPKQLLVLAGQPLIARVVEACCASPCSQVAVVLGAHASRIEPAYAHTRARTLYNADWMSGLASSLRMAAEWAENCAADGLLLCACDQPLLATSHLEALCSAFARAGKTLASTYAGVRGVPALIESSWLPRLRELAGDRGAAPLLRGSQEVGELSWPEGAVDIDTPADLAAFLHRP